MAKHSLRTLLKLRLAAVNAAKADLVGAMHAEEAASLAEASVGYSIHKELAAAADNAADDATVERLAGWLPRARAQQKAARERFGAAEATTARARAALAAAASAEAVIENLIEVRGLEAKADAERQVQAALDEHMFLRPAERRG